MHGGSQFQHPDQVSFRLVKPFPNKSRATDRRTDMNLSTQSNNTHSRILLDTEVDLVLANTGNATAFRGAGLGSIVRVA